LIRGWYSEVKGWKAGRPGGWEERKRRYESEGIEERIREADGIDQKAKGIEQGAKENSS